MSKCRVGIGLFLLLRPGLALAQTPPVDTPPYFIDQTMSNCDTHHVLVGWFTSTFIIDRETSCAPPAVRIYPPDFFLAATEPSMFPLVCRSRFNCPPTRK